MSESAMMSATSAKWRVCVVMPAYRAAGTIGRAIQSVLGQNYTNLIIGVGVPAGDAETIDAASAAGGKLVQIVPQSGHGISDARNSVFRNVEADLYMFLDADDVMEPGTISAYIENYQQSNEAGLRYADFYIQHDGSDLRVLKRSPFRGKLAKPFPPLARMNFIGTGSVMVDRDVLLRVGFFDEEFDHAEDWHLWLRIAKEFPFFHVDHPAYTYTYGKMTAGKLKPLNFFKSEKLILKDVSPNWQARILPDLLSSARTAWYYLRTIPIRRQINQIFDVSLLGLAALPAAAAFYILFRKRGIL